MSTPGSRRIGRIGGGTQKTIKTYDYTAPYTGSTFAYLVSEEGFNYEGQITPLATKATYEYDIYGNPTKVTSSGDINIAGDEKEAITEYIYNTNLWILGLPSHSILKDSQGQIVLENWLYYDDNINYTDTPTKGNLTKEESWLDTPAKPNPTTQYAYDNYGNLTSSTDARGKTITTAYDTLIYAYPEIITNHIGHSIQNTYDYKTGQILTTTDTNNQTSRSEYDVFGRVSKIFGPNDDALHPQTWYEYDLTTLPTKITTYIREEANTDDPLKIRTSYAFIDGLGRTIQVKIEADDPLKQIVSGIVKLNAKGQVEHEYLPYSVNKTSDYTTPSYSQVKTTYEYDVLGRVVKSINPDSTYGTAEYLPGEVIAIDANGHKTKKYQDIYNQTVKIEEFNHGRTYTTTYSYDTQGNLLETTDDHGNIISIFYDSLGRKTAMDDPDMGQWSYEYDENGNLIKQTDSKGQILEFVYDDINRLTEKLASGQTIVTYRYDSYSDLTTTNVIGRLSQVVDQNATTVFYYDNLGREIKTEKTIDVTTYTVERTYDALDRLTALTYPDGEIVNYTYTTSGGVKTVIGNQTYVSDTTYTEIGQMSRVDYGNTTYTDYSYDPLTLRLARLTTNGGVLQDLQYQFNNVGNIATITDSVNTATQSFVYDDLNRLTQAIGVSYGTKTYRYDSIGNILEKDGVNFTYGEGTAGPHALTSGNNGMTITYDDNGNMLTKNSKTFEYDVENRLTKVTAPIQGGGTSVATLTLQPGWNFVSLPLIPQDTQIDSVFSSLDFGTDYDQVSSFNPTTSDFDNYNNNDTYNQFDTVEYGKGYLVYVNNTSSVTLALSGQLPITNQQVSFKSGWNLIGTPSNDPIAVSDALSSLTLDTDYDRIVEYNSGAYVDLTQSDTLQPGKAYFMRCLRDATWDIMPQPQTEVTQFAYDGDGGRIKKSTSSNTTVYVGSLYEEDSIGKATKHIFMGSNRVASIENSNAYFYHSDHLGSSSIITDQAAQQVQYLEYMPFGQVQVDTGTEVTDYKFTGKELDASTGLYYYGARYYDAEIGRFTQPDSIVQAPYDPQTLNRYTYCRNNPVKYVDPSGHFFSLIAAIVGAIIGAVTGGVAAHQAGGDIWKGVLFGAAVGFIAGGIAQGVGTAMADAMQTGGISIIEGAIMTGTEFGIAGFGAGATAGYAGGKGSAGDVFKSAGIGFASGFAVGAVVGATYTAGWQDWIHGVDTQEINSLYNQAEKALEGGNFQAYAEAASKLSKMGITPPLGKSPLGVYRDPSRPLGFFADNPVIHTNTRWSFEGGPAGIFSGKSMLAGKIYTTGEFAAGSSRIFIYGIKETMKPTSWVAQAYSVVDHAPSVSPPWPIYGWKTVTEDAARSLSVTREAEQYFVNSFAQ